MGFLAAASGITELELDSGRCGHASLCADLGWLFSNLSPLKLHALYLDGWQVDAAGAKGLLPHLGQLRELRIGRHVQSASLLWPALETAEIKLQTLHAKRQASPQLLQYLSSFSGLQELSMSGVNEYRRDSDTLDIAATIRTHALSLRELDILCKRDIRWGYCNEIADALGQCTALRTLAVAVPGAETAVSTTLPLIYTAGTNGSEQLELFHLVASLPLFETLQIELVMPPLIFGAHQARQARDYELVDILEILISNCIHTFSIPKGSRLHEIEWYPVARHDQYFSDMWSDSEEENDDDDHFYDDYYDDDYSWLHSGGGV
jgi:hypothetical protein